MSDLTALRTLREAALGLAKKTTSGRLALAQVATLADPRLFPAAWRADAERELASFRVEPDPLNPKDLEKLLKQAWDEAPKKVLDDLDTTPFAVTVGAQVHRAEHEGRPVVVKVLKPGLAELVRADLKLLETLVAPARAAFPASDPGALLKEVSERVLDELDLEHEGSAQRSIARALRGTEGVAVPGVLSGLTHPGVLVREFAPGTPLSEDPTPADPEASAKALITAGITAARAGTLHCDPEPGNVLLQADGTIALIDAGASARVEAERIDLAAWALESFLDDDAEGFAAALADLGWVTDRGTADTIRELGHAIGAPLLNGPAKLDLELLASLAERLEDHVDQVPALAANVSPVPQDLWPLRGIGGLALSLARLGATLDWPQVAREALRG